MGELLDKTDRAGALVGEGGFAGLDVAGANEVGEDFVAGLEGGFGREDGEAGLEERLGDADGVQVGGLAVVVGAGDEDGGLTRGELNVAGDAGVTGEDGEFGRDEAVDVGWRVRGRVDDRGKGDGDSAGLEAAEKSGRRRRRP